MLSKTETSGDNGKQENKEELCKSCEHREHAGWLEKNGLMASVLLGSLIIAMSVLYIGKVDPSSPNTASQGVNAKVLGQQTNPDTANEEKVQVQQRPDAPFIGQAAAKVVVEEFSDFQCPFCQRFFLESYSQLKAKYVDTGKVKFVFRHMPLPFHQNAQKAAEAAECANRQGKFASYHDLLFTKAQADGTGLAVSELKQYAKDLSLDTAKFNTCLDKGEAAAAVAQDNSSGSTAAVTGTPTFFVNGKRVVGAQPTQVFEQAIEQALAE